MTCKRCEDIHKAQEEGLTQESCKCDCHNIISGTWLTNSITSDNFILTDCSGSLTTPINWKTDKCENQSIATEKKRGIFHKPEDGFCSCDTHVDNIDIILCGCPRPCYCNIIHSKECIRNTYKLLSSKDKC